MQTQGVPTRPHGSVPSRRQLLVPYREMRGFLSEHLNSRFMPRCESVHFPGQTRGPGAQGTEGRRGSTARHQGALRAGTLPGGTWVSGASAEGASGAGGPDAATAPRSERAHASSPKTTPQIHSRARTTPGSERDVTAPPTSSFPPSSLFSLLPEMGAK